MKLNFFFPLLGLCLGIFISDQAWLGKEIALVIIGCAIFIWLILTILSKNPIKSYLISKWHPVWIFLLFVGIGSLDFYYRSLPEISEDLNGRNLKFTGVIKDYKYSNKGDQYKVDILSIKDSLRNISFSNLNILVKTDGFIGSKGDVISFLAVPLKYSTKDNEDLENQMRHNGITFYTNVKTNKIQLIKKEASLFTAFNDYRNHLIILLEKSSLNRSTSEFIISILLGDKSFLSQSTKQTLNSVGLAHILALSGMHIAIMLSIFMVLLFPISLLGHAKLRYILSLSLLWAYVLLSGSSPSTVRAALMATFLIGAWLLERKHSPLNALLAAVFLILIYNPLYLWDIGLQLSFICVASILIFANKLNPIEQHRHPVPYKIVNLLLITVITTFCTWALIAFYFKNIPLLFLPANLLLLPLLPWFIGISLFYLVSLVLGTDISFISGLINKFHDFIIGLADFLSLSGSTTLNINIPLSSVIFWILGIIFFSLIFILPSLKFKKFYSLIASVLLIISVVLVQFSSSDESQSIKFLHSFTKMEAQVLHQSSHIKLNFPRRGISSSTLDDTFILSIDSPLHNDSINYLLGKSKNNNYILVGPSADVNQIAELTKRIKNSNIILHSGIGKNKKEELLNQLEESYWEKIYSLREIGSLSFDL